MEHFCRRLLEEFESTGVQDEQNHKNKIQICLMVFTFNSTVNQKKTSGTFPAVSDYGNSLDSEHLFRLKHYE